MVEFVKNCENQSITYFQSHFYNIFISDISLIAITNHYLPDLDSADVCKLRNFIKCTVTCNG